MPNGVPLTGGLALGCAFVVVSLIGLFYGRAPSAQSMGLVMSSLIMLILGVVDDLHELSVGTKFLAQLVCAFILIIFGIKTQIVYIGELANVVITLVWVLAITNALNHLDVMDGVAGGCALIIALAFFIVSGFGSHPQILALALMGSILGFLIFNLPPAQIYMGNSGSHFLGFVLAEFSLTINYASLERKVALLSPLLILGFPLYDTAFLILMRLKKKRLPFKKSNDHLVLRFLALGYSKKKALSVMFSWTLFFALSGIALSRAANPAGAAIIAVVAVASLLLTGKMSGIKVSD